MLQRAEFFDSLGIGQFDYIGYFRQPRDDRCYINAPFTQVEPLFASGLDQILFRRGNFGWTIAKMQEVEPATRHQIEFRKLDL